MFAIIARLYGQPADVLAAAHAAAILAFGEALIYITPRLSLPVGTYSKTGGKAHMVISEAGATYVNSRGESKVIAGVQVERQWAKLGFNVPNGLDLPLVRASRAAVEAVESTEPVENVNHMAVEV